MKKTLVSLDAGHIFTLLSANDSGTFSSVKVSAGRGQGDPVAVSCTLLDEKLSANRPSGGMIVRITTPAEDGITLAESAALLDKIDRYSRGEYYLGIDSDDSTRTITLETIFQTRRAV